MNRSAARRILIDIARRKRPKGTGSDLHALMALPRRPINVSVPELFSDLPYAIIGGIATRAYMPERFTKDIDILVPPDHFEEAEERLQSRGWHPRHSLHFSSDGLSLRGSAWSNGSDEIDLITADASWIEEAVADPIRDPSGMNIIPLPFLILMKLDASRVQDTSDIARMLALADDETIARAKDVLRRFSQDSLALEDFESLLQIGRWELEQPS